MNIGGEIPVARAANKYPERGIFFIAIVLVLVRVIRGKPIA